MNSTIKTVLSMVGGFAIGSFLFEAVFKNLFMQQGPNWMQFVERTFFFSMGAISIAIIYKFNGVLRD